MAYTYKLYGSRGERPREEPTASYSMDELTEMTTFQLRSICTKEKLVEGVAGGQDREGLIRTILKFRNREESRLIREVKPGGFQRIQEALELYLKAPLGDNGDIAVPAKVVLYAGMEVARPDGYLVQGGGWLAESNVLIVNELQELCGILHLVKDTRFPGQFVLQSGSIAEVRAGGNRMYSLLLFPRQDSEYLHKAYYGSGPLPPANLHYWKFPVAELEIREAEVTGAVLAIDFGTANTTAGAYLDSSYVASPSSRDLLSGRVRLDQINLVLFPETEEEAEWTELLPTAMAVADCSDSGHIEYVFGHEALAMAKRFGYGSQASLFRGMKRWVNDYTKQEELGDPKGNGAAVSRKEMLRAFLLYIIGRAEHQFKCRFKNIHISAPIKLKSQFSRMFAELLPEYELEAPLDEGMAVLYNSIAEGMARNSFREGEWYQALVLDCGGGTTDLSSCRFSMEDGHLAYRMELHTTYENGDTNFGGNNLTFRLMQFMKVVFADYYRLGAGADIDALIPIPGADLYRYVDEHGAPAVYHLLEERYRQAEAYIPTRFKEVEHRSREDYLRIKNNFYFCGKWQRA